MAPGQPASRHPLTETHVTFTAGTAFKAGFFGLFGAFAAAAILTIAVGLSVGLVFALFFVAA